MIQEYLDYAMTTSESIMKVTNKMQLYRLIYCS